MALVFGKQPGTGWLAWSFNTKTKQSARAGQPLNHPTHYGDKQASLKRLGAFLGGFPPLAVGKEGLSAVGAPGACRECRAQG